MDVSTPAPDFLPTPVDFANRSLSAAGAELRDNERGIRERQGAESLHGFRVGVRRSRSLLANLKGATSKASRGRLVDDFKWLGRETSAARDLDVCIETLAKFRADLPAALSEALAPVATILEEWDEASYAALRDVLDDARYVAMVHEVADGTPLRAPEGEGGEPTDALARRRIARALRRVLKQGRAVHAGSNDAKFHDLRKAAKQLRYLIHSFRPLLPAFPSDGAVKSIKRLQKYLGAFQDGVVQADIIRRARKELSARGTLDDMTRAATALLLESLKDRQDVARGRFEKSFRTFASPKVQAHFSTLLAVPESQRAASPKEDGP